MEGPEHPVTESMVTNDTHKKDRSALARLLEYLVKTAENQKAYFETRQFVLPSIEDYTDEEGHIHFPQDIGPLLDGCMTNGRYSEADWWVTTISGLARQLEAGGDLAIPGNDGSAKAGTGNADATASPAADRDRFQVEYLEDLSRAREKPIEEALVAIRRASLLDDLVSGSGAAVMARFAEIHQHADAALALATGQHNVKDGERRAIGPSGVAANGPVIGPVPAYECDFSVGQPVRIMSASNGEDPDKVWFITGIQWRHQRGRTDFGWDITLASREDIERGYGATDGFRPEELVAAFCLPKRFEDRIAARAHENGEPSP